MTNVARAAAVLTGEVIRVHGKPAAAIRVILLPAKRVIALQRDVRIQPAAEANSHHRLAVFAARLVLIDVTERGIRSNAGRRRRRDGARQRRVNVARANHMRDAERIEGNKAGNVPWQLTFDLQASQREHRSLQIRSDTVDSLLRRGDRRELRRGRHGWEEVQQVVDRPRRRYVKLCLRGRGRADKRFSEYVGKFIAAVKTIRSQRESFLETVVEDATTAANHGLRRSRRLCRARRPGEAEAWSNIESAADIALVLVPDAVAKHKVRAHSPIVLHVYAHINLRDSSGKVTCVNAEL